jgi:EipB-like
MLALIQEHNDMRITALYAITLFALGFLPSPGHAVNLAAYRALYALEPARVDTAASQVPIDGAIAYEVRGADCAGYSLDSRFATRYVDAQGGAKMVDMESTTFESPDGLDFEVNEKQTVNAATADDERITVKRSAPGQTATGEVKGTKEKNFELGPESLFPTVYEKKLLAAASKGEGRDDSVIYDGSDAEKQYRAITFIGKKRTPGTYLPDAQNPQATPLLGLVSWPFSIGYYSLTDTKAEAPEFQASFNMYENGVTTEMLFDYGSYALKGHLQKLEMLPAEACDGRSKLAPPAPDDSSAGKVQ